MQTAKRFLPVITVLATLIALVTAFWSPTLFSHKTLLHGDSLLHGLSLWDYHAQNVNRPENFVWDRNTYGGHPLFAESQGDFAFPLNMLLARTMSPIYANNFAHWVEMILAGIGVYGLSRTLKLSSWSGGFAAIAMVFSSHWLLINQNMTVGAAAMCVPWLIWAAECWIGKPSWRTAIFLGLTAAQAVLAGYPHYLQGSIIYIVISMLPNLLEKKSRNDFVANFSAIWKTGLLAVLVGTGLAAVQLLPLLELVNQSHRSAGTGIMFFDLPITIYLRGLFFNLHTHEFDSPNFLPVLGSLLVCLLFSLFVFFKLPARSKGHIAATLLLLNLGMGGASPITSFLYNYHLVPGIHYFRLLTPYFVVAAVGIGIVSAIIIEHLTFALNNLKKTWWTDFISSKRIKIGGTIFLLFWIAALHSTGIGSPIEVKQTAIAVFAALIVMLLTIIKRASIIPSFLFLLLATETASMKLHEYKFGDISILSKPETVKIIEADDPQKNYKLYSTSTTFMYALGSPLQQDLFKNARDMLAHLCGLSNLRWNLPSMMGSLALPLRDRALVEPILESESRGISESPVGLRLIDLLSVKYIVADAPVNTDGFRLKFNEPATNTWLIENTAAKPRFQIYTNYIFSKSPQDALTALRTTKTTLLALEAPKDLDTKAISSLAPATVSSVPQINLSLTNDTSTHYELSIQAKEPGWLFLADNNYPGWRGYIDGNETPVYTAQIIGKAIFIPAGEHNVKLIFKSASLQFGLWITLATLTTTVTASLMAIICNRRRKLL